jgi:hypothetical protein
VRRQRLNDELAQRAVDHMLAQLDSPDAQIAVVDHELEQIAAREPWSDAVAWLSSFRGISTRTAHELMSYLGLTPTVLCDRTHTPRGGTGLCSRDNEWGRNL